MRKIGLVLGLAIAVVMMATAAMAQPTSAGVAQVIVHVTPDIAVSIPTVVNDLGNFSSGEITANLLFRIDANLESLGLYAEASPLFKGDDPTNTAVPPIPVDLTAGVTIAPTNANPTGGASNVASFTSTATTVNGFPATQTVTIPFESSQNCTFSQNVLVTVNWTLTNAQQPVGEYSGVVRLTAVSI